MTLETYCTEFEKHATTAKWKRLEYVLRTRRNLQTGDERTREDVRRRVYALQAEEKQLWAQLRPDLTT